MRIRTLLLKVALGILAVGTVAFMIFILPNIKELMQAVIPNMAILQPLTQAGLAGTGICFIYILFQTFKLILNIDRNEAFSESTIKCLKNIRNSGYVMTGIYVLLMPIIYLIAEFDDAPGLILFGAFFVFVAAVIVAFADVLNKLFANALAYKKENDLTI